MQTKQPKRRLLKKLEYAALLGVSSSAVDKWVKQGKITPVRTPGGYPRFIAPPEIAEEDLPDA